MPRETARKIRLECRLTLDEMVGYSRKMAEARQNRIEAEANLKAVMSQIKAEIADYEAQEGKYIMQIQTGKEWREVECAVTYNFDRGIKTFCRKDTGDVVKEELITDAEKQEELKLNPPNEDNQEASAEQTPDGAEAYDYHDGPPMDLDSQEMGQQDDGIDQEMDATEEEMAG